MTTTQNLTRSERIALAGQYDRQGLSREQIAARLQVPSSTAGHLINEARRNVQLPISDPAFALPSPCSPEQRRVIAANLRAAGYSFERIALHIGRSVAATRAAVRDGQAIIAGVSPSTQIAATWMTRSFGVEVEHSGTSLSSSMYALRRAGLDAIEPGYTHAVMSQWKLVHDGSCGNEAVSPILSGDAGLAELATAMNALRAAGASVNRNCGMHVHVDMTGLDGPAIARLLELYVAHQDDLDSLVAVSRRRHNNSYCSSWADNMSGFRQAVDEIRSTRSITRHYNRYQTINVMSFPRYGTIEMRQHQGTLAPLKAQAWIVLMLALVEIARADRCSEVQSGADFVPSVARIVNMPSAVRRRLVARRASLAGSRV